MRARQVVLYTSLFAISIPGQIKYIRNSLLDIVWHNYDLYIYICYIDNESHKASPHNTHDGTKLAI